MKIDIQSVLMNGVEAHQRGDLNTAAAQYQRILSLIPAHADANHLLGLVLFQAEKNDEAEELIQKAISIDNKVALYHANLGRVLKSKNHDLAAVEAFREAIQLSPNDAVLHADLASALIGIGDADGARARAHLALELSPDLAEAHLNLGLALQELHGPTDEEAQKHLKQALSLNSSLAGGYLALGVANHEAGDVDGAVNFYRQALVYNPNFIEAHTNLGNIARLANDFENAVHYYRAALAIHDDIAEVWGNLGITLQEMGEIHGALDAYDRGIALSPEDPEIRRNRGMARLMAGYFDEGWRDYRYRWKTMRFRELARDWPCPEWTGEMQKGARILVHAEQGLGDTIQFSRYLKVLNDLGFRVHFECPNVLLSLYEEAPYLKSVFTPSAMAPRTDFHVPLLNLPGLLAPDFDKEPFATPYLSASKSTLKKWSRLTRDWPKGIRVGIAWRGNPDHIRDDLRSPGLEAFTPLFQANDLVLVSLQKNNAAEELAALPSRYQLIDPTPDIDDFDDTAGLIEQLDVVVSCDSAPLHLAGAMGRKTFAVLSHVAEWRWGTNEDHTPWYPSIQLIRQPDLHDWESVFEKLCNELAVD